MWAGLSNCYFWIDPVNGLSGVVLAQVLPFADPRAMGVWLDFETAAYAAGLTG
jgi:methyl acetate hydrolase